MTTLPIRDQPCIYGPDEVDAALDGRVDQGSDYLAVEGDQVPLDQGREPGLAPHLPPELAVDDPRLVDQEVPHAGQDEERPSIDRRVDRCMVDREGQLESIPD